MQEFMDDVRKQLNEMRKLKAIIVKHENRIRALEAAIKTRDEDVLDAILSAPEKDAPLSHKVDDDEPFMPSTTNLAPDEV